MVTRNDTQMLCYNCFRQHGGPEGPCPHCGFDLAENEKKFPVALRAGTVLNNRYIVGRVLGQGGFGITYLALDTQLNARVAIKEYMPGEIATRMGTTVSVMADTKSNDFNYGAERFMEEARTLAKFLGHPNIAGVSSYFDQNDTSYFVMDYIEGVSFKSYIESQGGQVSIDDTLNVMIPVLRALTAVHAEGFIHRDVTPDNIYISKDGNVKLLDFGSARYSIGDKSKSLDVILKVGYAPKEQYIRRGRQGPYTDVYSCAACFYAAITGYLPPESLERLDQDTLVPISQAGFDIPEWLDKAILKGLAVQPEDRFQSAAEFLDAIENQLMVEVPTAGQSAPATPAKKKMSPLVIGGIAAALAVAIGVGAMMGGGGNSGGETGGGNPITEALAPKITIAGEEFSTDADTLDLSELNVVDADLVKLKEMTNLRRLMLPADTNFSDLSPLSELTQLTYLWFYSEGGIENLTISDWSPLASLSKLERLRLVGTAKDLTFLSNLTNLTELRLHMDDIEDLSGIENMTQLQSFVLKGNCYITDLSPLSGLTQLQILEVPGCDGEELDISPLGNLVQLQELRLGSSIPDLTPLSRMTKLRTLDLNNGGRSEALQCEDLQPLAGLTELTELTLYSRYIRDLSPLASLTKLKSLYIYNALSVTDLSPLSVLTELKSVTISAVMTEIDPSPIAHVPHISID